MTTTRVGSRRRTLRRSNSAVGTVVQVFPFSHDPRLPRGRRAARCLLTSPRGGAYAVSEWTVERGGAGECVTGHRSSVGFANVRRVPRPVQPVADGHSDSGLLHDQRRSAAGALASVHTELSVSERATKRRTRTRHIRHGCGSRRRDVCVWHQSRLQLRWCCLGDCPEGRSVLPCPKAARAGFCSRLLCQPNNKATVAKG